MPRRLATALIGGTALISLCASSASGLASGPVQISIPSVVPILSSWVTPKRLSRVEATPIALDIRGQIKTVDGSQPPPIQELVLDLDRHIASTPRGSPSAREVNAIFASPI